ncbi:uncharacterized protein LOC128723759 [Anopheles nili]|uniref:uncharacterized protein LOC128723759 n=1 Tax=Anopheles nili TaxID=185578 RepID=UPI00237B1424|nr:uncharacterized protein LOC128723759 [Anopheles nili]
MDSNENNESNMHRTESELLESIKKKGIYSLEANVSSSKALLRRQVGRNGDNLYDLLVRLISNLLDNPQADTVDHFDEYCRLAKIEFLSKDHRFLRSLAQTVPADDVANKQSWLARQTLQALTQIERKNIRCCPEFNHGIRYSMKLMGWDLPRGYDYFISCQINQVLCSKEDVQSCRFWGIIRSLCCDYYILEVEHREKSVDYCAYQGVIGRHPEIITDILDGLLKATLERTKSQSSLDVLQDLSVASLENLTQCFMVDLLKKLEIVDSEIEKEHCRMDMDALITELIEHLSISLHPSEETISALSTDPCASSGLSEECTASWLRIQLERVQLESRLNSCTFLVSENPRTKPWQELPRVTLDQLQATEGLRVFLVGDLVAPVASVVKPFDGVEKNLLRALIAKISAHRDGHINGSETNISLVRCLSGTYGSVIGYHQELLQERVERWCERNEQGMKYWLSEIWPGLCTFPDREQFCSIYIGWGIEKQNTWFSPIVRVPKLMDEYDGAVLDDSKLSKTSCNKSFNEALSYDTQI